MTDLARLETALRNADAAGDVTAARTIAAEIRRQRPPEKKTSAAGTFANRAMNALTLGLGDRIDAVGGAIQGRAPNEGQFSVGNYEGGFFGGFADRYNAILGEERADTATRREEHPIAAFAGDVVGSLAPGAAAAKAASKVVSGANALGRAGQAATAGAGLGALYGFNEGAPGERLRSAAVGGAVGAAAGGALSGAGEGLARAAAPIAERVSMRGAAREASELGISEDAARVARSVIDQDNPANVAARIARQGDDAMLADAGHGPSGLLDAALQQPGPAQQRAREAVEGRAANASRDLTSELDRSLGAPKGFREIGRDIASGTAEARREAYDAAYNSPIDYSGPGRKVEAVLARVPERYLKSAIQRANEAAQIDGLNVRQIMAQIDESGNARFVEMPTVQQLDYLKRALGEMGSETDAFGRPTADARAPQKLARMLRDAVGDAVPSYREALRQGADKIETDEAAKLGAALFKRGTSREQVAEGVQSMTPAQLDVLRQSARGQIDETLANVSQTLTDPNLDAREAMAALRFMNSRAGQEKIGAILGDGAEPLKKAVARATGALELRAALATNSKTAARQASSQMVDEVTEPGVVGQVLRGQPVNAARRVVQEVADTTSQGDANRKAQIYDDLARIMTEPRGPEALRVYRTLSDLAHRGEISTRKADRIRSMFRTGGVRVGAASGGVSGTQTARR